jgi:hypothetical protein
MQIRQFLLSLIFIVNASLSVVSSPLASDYSNFIKSIKRTQSGVEIELYSSRPFPVRALPPVLHIGSKEFLLSRNPDDGSLNILIFKLTPTEFNQINTGDPVTVQYGSDIATADRWDFQRLDKSLLSK